MIVSLLLSCPAAIELSSERVVVEGAASKVAGLVNNARSHGTTRKPPFEAAPE